MTALVDTSLLIDHPHAPSAGTPWSVSVITVGELQTGVISARDDEQRVNRLQRLTAILAAAPVLVVDDTVAGAYAQLRALARRRPSNDLWIAATALAHDLTLVTADERQAATPLVRTRLVGG